MDLDFLRFVIRNITKGLLFLAIIPIILLLLFLLLHFVTGVGVITETQDIAAYGVIMGNYDNDRPAKFIFSFFPEEISDDFSNVSYQYTAQKGDTYACQIWLEFDIEDEKRFHGFIDTHTDSEQVVVFRYDTSYMDYTLSNQFMLTGPENNEPGDIHIEYAKIGKILYCEDTQHIIFFAMCMYDGGFSSTKTFGDFFDRFGIDPIEYESTTASPYASVS